MALLNIQESKKQEKRKMYRGITNRLFTSASTLNCVKCRPTILNVPYRGVTSCTYLCSDKRVDKGYRQSSSPQHFNRSPKPESKGKVKKEIRQMIKSSFLSRTFLNMFLSGQDAFAVSKRHSLIPKRVSIRIKDSLVSLKREFTAHKHIEKESEICDNPNYEKAFNNSLEAFNQQSINQHDEDKQRNESINAQSDIPAYEQALSDSLEAFSDNSETQSVLEKRLMDAVEAFYDNSDKQNVGCEQEDGNVLSGKADSKYDHALSNALVTFEEHLQLQKLNNGDVPSVKADSTDSKDLDNGSVTFEEQLQTLIEAIQGLEQGAIFEETEIVKFKFENILNTVLNSTQGTTDTNEGTKSSEGFDEIRLVTRRNILGHFLWRALDNIFFGRGNVKIRNIFRKQEMIKKVDAMLQKLFSAEEKALLKDITKEELNKQREIQTFHSKQCRNSGKTQKQIEDELSQEVLKKVMTKILRNEKIERKLMMILDLAKDKENQKKALKFFIVFIIKFYIFPEVVDLWHSMSARER